jgi:uncharacterized protein YjbJ (UPF0337 family)
MDKDRLEGVGKPLEGSVKESVGKTVGDATLVPMVSPRG